MPKHMTPIDLMAKNGCQSKEGLSLEFSRYSSSTTYTPERYTGQYKKNMQKLAKLRFRIAHVPLL
jgi:hypothetical protein